QVLHLNDRHAPPSRSPAGSSRSRVLRGPRARPREPPYVWGEEGHCSTRPSRGKVGRAAKRLSASPPTNPPFPPLQPPPTTPPAPLCTPPHAAPPSARGRRAHARVWPRFHADRAAGGDSDHRHPHRPPAAGGAEGPRGRRSHPVLQQPQADGAGGPQLPRHH